MRKSICGYLCGCLIGMVATGSVMFSTSATANPPGVPVGDPPLSCITLDSRGSGNNYQIEAITGPNGEFPVAAPCLTDPGKQCADYGYMVTSLLGETVSQSLFAVSADQDLDGTRPSAFYKPPGDGDSSTGWLKYARHEYPVRFNSNGTVFEGHLYIRDVSSARISTGYIRGGKIDESCLIAGPGVPGIAFESTPMSTDESAAGGKCPARLYKNAKGEVINIKLFSHPDLAAAYPDLAAQDNANNCVANQPTPPEPGMKFKLLMNGDANEPPEPFQFVEGLGKRGITFGTGTTTVYLPSGWAICTAQPCPGDTKYVFTY